MDDDLYPNDGTYFLPREPKDQAIGRKKETAGTLEALPILQDLIRRLDERIAYYEKNSSVPEEVRTDPLQFLIVQNSYTLAAKTLISEKEYIEGLIDANAPNR